MSDPYIIGIFHPLTTEIKDAAQQAKSVFSAVSNFARKRDVKVFFLGSNNDPGYLEVKYSINSSMSDMLPEKFLELLAGASMVVGNSSCAVRECSYLGVPAINIGDRQKGRVTCDNVFHSNFSNIEKTMKHAWSKEIKPSRLFGDGKSSDRIITIIKERLLNG